MDQPTKSQLRRFSAMWTLLLWEGELRNSRLQNIFGLNAVQCSRLIAEFRRSYPGSVAPRSKGWVLASAEGFPEASDTVVEYLRLTGDSEGEVGDWLVNASTENLRVSSRHVRVIRAACVAGAGLRVRYHSMSSPDGRWRNLFPHSLVRLNHRWHVRAWCAERQQFRDFTLGRLQDVSPLDQPAPFGRPDDAHWNLKVDLVLRPHGQLKPDQALAVRREHFRGTVQRRLSVRACLAHYVAQEFRAAIDPSVETPPSYLMEVGNVDALRPYLFGAPDDTPG